MSADTGVTPSEAVKDADAALERLQRIVERLADADLHLRTATAAGPSRR
jgi:hypothetical protein